MDKIHYQVGWIVTPRKDCIHEDFIKQIGIPTKIVKLKKCNAGPCYDCTGNDPYVATKDGNLIRLCGYGSPGKNFIFGPGEWDE